MFVILSSSHNSRSFTHIHIYLDGSPTQLSGLGWSYKPTPQPFIRIRLLYFLNVAQPLRDHCSNFINVAHQQAMLMYIVIFAKLSFIHAYTYLFIWKVLRRSYAGWSYKPTQPCVLVFRSSQVLFSH